MNEPTLHAVRDLLLKQVRSARAALCNPRRISDDNVHEARKDLKRARASLRLLRETIGERRYAVENARLRNAARPLSQVRDAKVLLDTAIEFLNRTRSVRNRPAVRNLVEALRNTRNQLRAKFVPGNGGLKRSLSHLAASEHVIAQWSLKGADESLLRGVERLYRRSRKALRRAREKATDDLLHEARKQIKYLAYALEVMVATGTRHAAQTIKAAKNIGDYLGDDHDLSLIQSRLIKTTVSYESPPKDLLDRIAPLRKTLQQKAFNEGERLYSGKAKRFIKDLSLP